MIARTTTTAIVLAAATAVTLTGCAAPASTTEGLSIVASTNVYGDIAATIAGDLATVTSIIDSAAQDPHSYEASAQHQLAIATADLVIENGSGYDPFIDVLVEGSGTSAVVVSAASVAGLEDEHADDEAHSDDEAHADDDGHGHLEGVNEHVWYDLHVMGDVATAIATELAEIDAANAATYEENLTAWLAELEALEGELESVASALGGGVVATTEPVPAYLLAELGLDDETPAEFVEAIEEGADVPPLALQQTLDLIASGEIRLLAYNEQTASPETERVRAAAEAAGIPVVSFTETLPDAQDYVSWMRANIEAVAQALTPA
ncbi:metal ABC transporter solute-binding protein, Zn/Mn family [Microcella sp.]|uniref:metal ABC transporter solute-binding protein, Zn/Mn family n=1 Tax=Microcella sp. TaxID=1913979 RepID=UPI00299F72BC|nr:zinc ABC transporter substrate-binding protein [Microcella sp.]MDX2026852.1 zinc ABC transporter substrate-binding protein [Microcella sp.]